MSTPPLSTVRDGTARTMTIGSLGELPPTLPVWHRTEPSAAWLFGIGRSQAYGMAQRGDLPTIRLGPGRIVVPTMRLLRMLGAEPGVDELSNEGAS